MSLHWTDWPDGVAATLRRGVALPANPLALDERRRLDERRQTALTRYYLDAGAGGIAVGVHTTQFAIREAGLYEHVLRLAGIKDSWGFTKGHTQTTVNYAIATFEALKETAKMRVTNEQAERLQIVSGMVEMPEMEEEEGGELV